MTDDFNSQTGFVVTLAVNSAVDSKDQSFFDPQYTIEMRAGNASNARSAMFTRAWSCWVRDRNVRESAIEYLLKCGGAEGLQEMVKEARAVETLLYLSDYDVHCHGYRSNKEGLYRVRGLWLSAAKKAGLDTTRLISKRTGVAVDECQAVVKR